MKAHELAKVLFEGPDLDVVTHANNHTMSTWRSGTDPTVKTDSLIVGVLVVGKVKFVIIGNLSKRNINGTHEVIEQVLTGQALPLEWGP